MDSSILKRKADGTFALSSYLTEGERIFRGWDDEPSDGPLLELTSEPTGDVSPLIQEGNLTYLFAPGFTLEVISPFLDIATEDIANVQWSLQGPCTVAWADDHETLIESALLAALNGGVGTYLVLISLPDAASLVEDASELYEAVITFEFEGLTVVITIPPAA